MDTSAWTSEIDHVTQSFVKLLGRLDEKELNEQPDKVHWSPAQILDHIISINESYFQVIDRLLSGNAKTPWVSKLSFYVNYMGKTIRNAVDPGQPKKTRTFSIWEPAPERHALSIVEEFTGHQDLLKQKIEQCKLLLDKNPVISSPVNRWIVYRLDTAFNIIVAHEKRHLLQCERLLAGKPG